MPRTKNLNLGGIAKRLRSAVSGSSRRNSSPEPTPSHSGSSHAPSQAASRSGSEYMEEEEDVGGPIIATSQKMADAIQFFSNKRIENTRAVDLDVIERIGVLEPFLYMTERGGILRKFWGIKRPAYKRLTVEFLSSLTVAVENDEFVMRYRLLDTDQVTTASELAEYMGFVPGGAYKGTHNESMWLQITGDGGKPGEQPKGKYIQHPALRIIHRALGNTLFARGESSAKVRKEEFMVMTRMVYGTARYAKLDLAVMMMRYWEGISKLRRQGEGQVTIGGYITYLAEMKGINLARLADLTECTAPSLMDAKYLKTIGFLVGPDEGPWAWKNEVREPVPLPFPVPFHAGWPHTWLVPLAIEGAAIPDAPQAPPQMPQQGGFPGPQPFEPQPYGMPQYQVPPYHVPPFQGGGFDAGGASSSAPPPQPTGEFNYAALCESLANIARLSNESLELGRRISDKCEEIEREQAAARRDINLLLANDRENEIARGHVNEMYDWFFPIYGRRSSSDQPPPPPY